jgi:hypothetical protein
MPEGDRSGTRKRSVVEIDTIPKPDGLGNAIIKSKFEQALHEIVRCT